MPKELFPPLPENPVLDICPPDIILAGDSEEDSPSERQARGKRILKHAENYLRGETLYIHSARLRGPVVKNPWAKPANKRKAGHNMENRLKVTKRWKPTADPDNGKEILATPTQVHGWGVVGGNAQRVVLESPQSDAPLLGRHGGWTAINQPRTPPPIVDPPVVQTRPTEADTLSIFSNDNVTPVATPGKRCGRRQFEISPELSSAPLSPTDFYKRSNPKPTLRPPEQIPRAASRPKTGSKGRVANDNCAPLAAAPRSTDKHKLRIEDHGEISKPTAIPAPKRRRMKVDFSKMSPFAFTERNNRKRKRKRVGVGQGSEEANEHVENTTKLQTGKASGRALEEPPSQKRLASASQTYKNSRSRPGAIGGNTDVPSGTQSKHDGDIIALGPAPLTEIPELSRPINSTGRRLSINRVSSQSAQPPTDTIPTPTMIPEPKSSPREAISEKPFAEGADPLAHPTVHDDAVARQPDLGTHRDVGKAAHPGAPETYQSTQTQLIAAKKGFYDAMIESPFAFRSNLDSPAEGTSDVLRPDAFFDDNAKRTPGTNGSFTGGWGNRGRATGAEDLLLKTPAPRANNQKSLSNSQEQPRRIPPISLTAGAKETPKQPSAPNALTFTPFSAFETPVNTLDSKRREGISPLTFSPLRDATQPVGHRQGSSAKKSVKFAGFGLLDDGDDGADEDTAGPATGSTGYMESPKKGQQAEDAKEDLLKEVMGFMGNDVWDIDEELRKMATANPKSDRRGNASTKSAGRRQWR